MANGIGTCSDSLESPIAEMDGHDLGGSMIKFARPSLPSFVAGAVCATVLVAVPAVAVVTAVDQNPSVFDGTGPSLTVQPAQFVLGQSIELPRGACADELYNSVGMRLSWDASDATSGVASYDVLTFDPESGNHVVAKRTTATTRDITVTNWNNDCGGGFVNTSWWVVARDHRGQTAISSELEDSIDVWDETGVDVVHDATPDLTLTRTGAWSTSKCTCHNLGTTAYTSTKGGSITYSVIVDKPGRTLAIVAPISNNRGVMNVSVDGGAASAVNTYAGTTQNRTIVWQKSLAAGTHTLKIVNAGTAGRGRIDVDSIMLGPAWGGEALAEYFVECPSWDCS